MTDWQPIETAPTNGTRVLAYVSDEVGTYDCQIASYDDDYMGDPPRPFWRVDGDENGIYSRARHPTYWMPLPAPPVTS